MKPESRAIRDRSRWPYVYAEMANRLQHASSVARLGLAAALAVALVAALGACGGSDKKKETTPKPAGTAEPGGMKDTDPDSPDAPGGGGGGGGGNGSAGGGGGGEGPAAEVPPPPVIPPNYDPDPNEARGAIEQHLKVGRAALAATPADPETALREARLALAIDGANIDAAAMVAHAYVHKKQYDTAELVLDDLFKRESAKRNPRVLYVYGLVYERTRRPVEAALAFRQAVDLDPSFTSAQINLGVSQLRNKQYDEAAATFERLVSSGKTDAITYTSLASAYRGRSADYPVGSPDHTQWLLRAEESYKRAISANRNYGPAYYNLGLLYMDAEPFPDASGGGSMDTLARLQRAKTYFDEYKNMPGVDMKLYEERMKDVQKAIKREEKRRKKKPS